MNSRYRTPPQRSPGPGLDPGTMDHRAFYGDVNGLTRPSLADRAAGSGPLLWVLIHRCLVCHEVHLKRTAPDDNPLVFFRRPVRLWAQLPLPTEWRSQG